MCRQSCCAPGRCPNRALQKRAGWYARHPRFPAMKIGAAPSSTRNLRATGTERPGAGLWNGVRTMASSNLLGERRILALWLPRLPTDRIRRSVSVARHNKEKTKTASSPGLSRRPMNPQFSVARPSPGHTSKAEPIVGAESVGGAAIAAPMPAGVHGWPAQRPAMTGKESDYEPPLVITAKIDNALKVTAVDEKAARLSLKQGMALADARAMVPHLCAIEADDAADRKLM